MEPRIQYAKTSDGVDLAYWTTGEGKPLVLLNQLLASNVQYFRPPSRTPPLPTAGCFPLALTAPASLSLETPRAVA